MAYRLEQGDLIIDGWEQGVAASPHKGIANIQNANISTQINEVMAQFARSQQTMTDTTATGSLAFVDTNHVSLSIPNTNNLFKGNWITVTGSSNTTQLPNGTYYVPPSTGANFQLSQYYNVLNTPLPVTVNYLLVGGGGGGGGATSSTGEGAGGGGGGGQVLNSTSVLAAGAYPIVIGTGGAARANGVASTGLSLTANGGIAGHNAVSTSGGAGGNNGDGTHLGGTTTNTGGGGGGGASAAGSNSTTTVGANGGNGTATTISGSSVTYGGGAGGGNSGIGGTGGAGNGGATNTNGTAGTVNTGGGGGGAGNGAGTNTGAAGGSGIVVISYPALSILGGATGGSITQIITGGVLYNVHTFTTSGTFTVPNQIPIILSGFTAGLTASFTMVATIGKGVAQATETYYASGIMYHRYYVLDNQNLVWVYDDQNEILYSSTDNVNWFLPDFQTNWCTRASGIAVISGFLVSTSDVGMFAKSVVNLGGTNTTGTTWVTLSDVNRWAGTGQSTAANHFCLTSHTAQLYITDGSYVDSLFPDSALASPGVSTAQNVQSFCSWVLFSGVNEGEASVISGTTPYPADGKRVPVIFFVLNGSSLPSAISAGTVYYLTVLADKVHFTVFSAASGGSNLDITTGAVGTQYFNTFYPIASASASTGATPTYTLTTPALVLPSFESAQCLAEIGSNVLVGCASNIVYPWNQQSTQPSGIIPLPESNVSSIITVNQMGYIFTGNKANVYLTDGTQATEVISVPDYVAGVPGIPSTYIEPQFTWGGAAYVRGRVYFSLLDQTATKAGNCGGIWSFVPTQNLYIGQDVGISLRLENQNSYGSYNGYAPLIISRQTQVSGPPLYWSAWASSVSSPLYGMDYTSLATATGSVAVIDTDAIPVGTFLEKKTFKQVEYKLSSPLLAGESVAIGYRGNLTDIFTPLANVFTESGTVSGYFSENTEKMQWLQLQVILTPVTGSTGSFIRLREIRVR